MFRRLIVVGALLVTVLLQGCASADPQLRSRAAADYQALIAQGTLTCSAGCVPNERFIVGISRIRWPSDMQGDVKELIASAAAAEVAEGMTVCPAPSRESPQYCDVTDLREAKERFAAADAVVRHDLDLPVQ